MKKLLFLLVMIPLFVACSDNNNESEGEGYLTSLQNAKMGILGVWKTTTGGIYYLKYNSNEMCSGFDSNNLTEDCSKYEILKQDNSFIYRGYELGDIEGTGSYIDATIKILNEDEFIYTDKTNKEYKFTRVK